MCVSHAHHRYDAVSHIFHLLPTDDGQVGIYRMPSPVKGRKAILFSGIGIPYAQSMHDRTSLKDEMLITSCRVMLRRGPGRETGASSCR